MWRVLVLCCMISLKTSQTTGSVSECPDGWLASPATPTCVKLFRQKLNWRNARMNCLLQGADLVRIPNSDMNTFVTGLLKSTGNSRFWIGLHDLKTENFFVWLDDTKRASYTNWAKSKNQPNNHLSSRGSGDQDCAEIGTYTPQWQDDWCNRKSGFICEVPKSRMTCPWDWTLSRHSGTCVKMISEVKTTWANSRLLCKNKYGGDLVKIINIQMDTMIYGLTKGTNISSYWMGLHDVTTEGKYRWLDENTKPDFFNWGIGQPNNYGRGKFGQADGGGQDCGEIMLKTIKHKWFDSRCDQNISFVCEQPGTVTTPARTTTQKIQTSRTSTTSTTTTTTPRTRTTRRTTPRTTTTSTTTPRTTSTSTTTPRTTTPRITTKRATKTQPNTVRITTTNTTTASNVKTTTTTPSTSTPNQRKLQPAHTSPTTLTTASSDSWLVDPKSGSLLRVSKDTKSWIDARSVCQAQGGDLVKISDQDMNDLVTFLIGLNGGGRYWIGLHDVRTENKFVWLDEDEEAEYTNWADGQPNNFGFNKSSIVGSGQDCVSIGNVIPQWHDDICSKRAKYVCEKHQGVSANPLNNQPTDWLASPQPDTEVKIFPDLKTWPDARQTCQAEGGDLVIILDSDTNSFLANLIRGRGGGRHWIGLNDLMEENRFVWLDEENQANYTNWADGQPNNYRIKTKDTRWGQHCVEIGTFAPRWQDDDCSRQSKFVCGRLARKSATLSIKCPDGWTASPMSSTCVKVYQGDKSWSGARAVCQAVGGDLVKIPNRNMDTFLAELLGKDGTKQYWIGLHENQEKDKFLWLDEKNKTAYTNWARQEPSSSIKDVSQRPPHCAVFNNLTPPTWQPVACSKSTGFVCELTARTLASAHTGQGHNNHSSVIIGVLLGVCLVSAGLAAFLVYRRRESRKSLMSSNSRVSFTNLMDESCQDESATGL